MEINWLKVLVLDVIVAVVVVVVVIGGGGGDEDGLFISRTFIWLGLPG